MASKTQSRTKENSKRFVPGRIFSDLCLICMKLTSKNERQKLFQGIKHRTKTTLCLRIEHILDTEIDHKNNPGVVCSSCSFKLQSVLRKKRDLKQSFNKTKNVLEKRYGKLREKYNLNDSNLIDGGEELNENSRECESRNSSEENEVKNVSTKPRIMKSHIPTPTKKLSSDVNLNLSQYDAWIVINYKGLEMKRLPVAFELVPVVRAIGYVQSLGSLSHLSKVIISTENLYNCIFDDMCSTVSKELMEMSSNHYDALDQQKTADQLQNMEWDALLKKFTDLCPTFYRFLQAATVRPSEYGSNINKIRTAVCSAGAKIISIFNYDITVARHRSNTLAKLGAKIICFMNVVNHELVHNLKNDHDKELLLWKEAVEQDIETERLMQYEMDNLKSNSSTISNDEHEDVSYGKVELNTPDESIFPESDLTEELKDDTSVKSTNKNELSRSSSHDTLQQITQDISMCAELKDDASLTSPVSTNKDDLSRNSSNEALQENTKDFSVCCDSHISAHQNYEVRFSEHQQSMHPGYDLVGHYVALKDPNRTGSRHQRKEKEMFNVAAYKNRISGNHLPNTGPQADILTMPFDLLMPQKEDLDILLEELAILVAKVWAEHFASLFWMKGILPKYIDHENVKDVKQMTERVSLGVIPVNENGLDKVQDIAYLLHKYVPFHDENDNEYQNHTLDKITCGGDTLNFERLDTSKALHSDGKNASQRLEGLIPNIEFHNFQNEWNALIWAILCKSNSHKDIGTLLSARNTIHARNVGTDPENNYEATEEFLNKYTEAYIVAGGLDFFGIDNTEKQPKANIIDRQNGDKENNLNNILSTVRKFLDEHFLYKIFDLGNCAPVSLEIKCRFCDRVFEYRKGPSEVRCHEKDRHNYPLVEDIDDENIKDSTTEEDYVLNYTNIAMVLLLQRFNVLDAIKLGDGNRMFRNIQLMYLYFKAAGNDKYARVMLETIAQVKCLLSERASYRLMWNRTVNKTGRIDENYPKDLDIKHHSELMKQDLTLSGGNEQNHKDVRGMKSKENGPGKRSSENSKRDNDVKLLYQQFHKAQLFSAKPGRAHGSFEGMKLNDLMKLDILEIKEWMYNSLRYVYEKQY